MTMKSSMLVAALAVFTATASAQARDIVIANEGGFPPYNLTKPDGTLDGFDIDIGNAICKIIEANCSYVTNEWSGIIPALLASKFDVIIGGMGITEERKQRVIFSDVYARSPSRFGVIAGNEVDLSPQSLQGKVIGVQQGTTNAAYLEKFYPANSVRRYPSIDALLSDLKLGRVDIILGATNRFEAESTDAVRLVEIGPPIEVSGGIGIAFRPEDTALRDEFNEALKQLRADGTWTELATKWGIPLYN